MQASASPRKPQDTSSSFAVPRAAASDAVSAGPASAPQLPPAEMKPNSRAACSGRNRSVIRLQNTETTNRLNTLTQTKKQRATHGAANALSHSAQKKQAKDHSDAATSPRSIRVIRLSAACARLEGRLADSFIADNRGRCGPSGR